MDKGSQGAKKRDTLTIAPETVQLQRARELIALQYRLIDTKYWISASLEGLSKDEDTYSSTQVILGRSPLKNYL
jgi:hypothetical protein